MILLGYQSADECPPRRDRVRCASCRRWTRHWVTQGLLDYADPDAVSRRLCDHCAINHRRTAA